MQNFKPYSTCSLTYDLNANNHQSNIDLVKIRLNEFVQRFKSHLDVNLNLTKVNGKKIVNETEKEGIPIIC